MRYILFQYNTCPIGECFVICCPLLRFARKRNALGRQKNDIPEGLCQRSNREAAQLIFGIFVVYVDLLYIFVFDKV